MVISGQIVVAYALNMPKNLINDMLQPNNSLMNRLGQGLYTFSEDKYGKKCCLGKTRDSFKKGLQPILGPDPPVKIH